MTVEAVDTLQTQGQREDKFFAVTLNEDGVQGNRRIPRSKLRRTMGEFAENLLKKEISGLYVKRK